MNLYFIYQSVAKVALPIINSFQAECPKDSATACPSPSPSGRRQALDLTLGLYRAASTDPEVDQKNALLVPTEMARVVAAMVQAGVQGEEEEVRESRGSNDR